MITLRKSASRQIIGVSICSWNPRLRASLLMLFVCTIVSCKNSRDSPAVQSFITYLETDSLGSLSPQVAETKCGSILLAGAIGYDGIGEQCWHRVADSLFYEYRGHNGEPLIRGKRVLLSAERVEPFLDSLRAAIAANFGKQTNCRSYDPKDPYYSRIDVWHLGSRTVFLTKSVITDTAALRPGVTIESASGNRTCAMLAGGPRLPL